MKQEQRELMMKQLASQIDNCQYVISNIRERIEQLIKKRQAEKAVKKLEDIKPDSAIIKERQQFTQEQKDYVLSLGQRLQSQLHLSTLKISKIVAKEMKMNQRTVYSWLKCHI